MKRDGQAMVMVLIIGSVMTGLLVSYRTILNQRRKSVEREKARHVVRESASNAVEIVNQLMKSRVIVGYTAVNKHMYYAAIPQAFPPAKRLNWQMTDGYVANAKVPPVAFADIDVCPPANLLPALIARSYKTNPTLPACATVPAKVIFQDGVNGKHVQLATDVN